MKITKYSHACFVVEKDDKAIIVDPGGWSHDIVIPSNVVAIVITHEHGDHCDKEQLGKILSQNTTARIYTHEAVAAALADLPVQTVTSGESVTAEGFTLEFCGGDHALIHESIPLIANLGVIIDGTLYYPGDSFTRPPRAIETVALPVSAPWMKLSEAMDFLTDLRPQLAFPTHDAILSETGQTLVDTMLTNTAKTIDTVYERIQSGASREL